MAQDKTSTPVNSQKKAMGLYLAAKAAEAAERDFGKTYIEPLGPGEEITRPDNFLYEALSNPRLNRGLSNIGEAFIGEGTGSLAGDLLVGLTGGGAGVATELAGGKSGAVDWIPGGSVMKAGLLGLVKAGKAAEAKVIVDILQNPIANRFANRYPEEAIKSLQEFVKKHPSLKDMNTAEVYDVMQSGKLGDEYFVDLGKDYPEAMNIFGNTNSKMFTYDGKRMSLREILEANKNRYSENYTRPLEEMLDKVDELRERGDYVGAFLHSGVADQNIFAMLNVPPHMLPETTMESFRKKLLDAVPKKLPSDSRGDYIRSFGGKVDREADLINEYMHLQGDPIDWERIVDMDDRLAEDIANYGSIKAAEKAKQEEQLAAAMQRKEAAKEAQEARQYEQRLKEYRKNPKKALKAANSAAPKQVRSQGEKAVREWYFGTDPVDDSPAKVAVKEAPKEIETPAKEVVPEPVPEPVQAVVEEPVVEAKGGPGKWRENGWTPEGHPITEPGMNYYVLGKDATDEDRRALFVLDSLANEAAREIVLNGRFMNDWPGRAKFRHQGTNYDSKSRKYGEDIAWNARTGNLPTDTRKILLRTATSSAGNRLPGQMTGFMDGKDLYDELFRKKVDRKIRDLDNRYVVDFLGY